MSVQCLDALIAHIQPKFNDLACDATRLFHGRGHCYEGLSFVNIDWFKPVIWVVLYGDVADETVDALSVVLRELATLNKQVKTVMMQRRVKGRAQQDIIYGELDEHYVACEDAMQFSLKLSANQNIGFFLDAQPARKWVKNNSAGKRVLNLFSYTCSFSVAALKGGAAHVVNIDMAKGAIATGQKNHSLNDIDRTKASFLPHDIFRSTKKLTQYGPYDLIIIDPPSRQKGSFEAEKDYAKLLRKLSPMLADGAEILACLNAPYLDENFLPALFAEDLPAYTLHERLPQREDFPEADVNCCLKMQIFKPAQYDV